MLAALIASCEDNPDTNCAGLITFNWTLVIELGIFILTTFLLWSILWKPVVEAIESRQAVIDAGIKANEEAERQLANAEAGVRTILESARTEARSTIEQAARAARQQAEEARAVARREAEQLVEKARKDITIERDTASLDLKVQTEALVQAAAERVIGRVGDPGRLRKAVRQAVPR